MSITDTITRFQAARDAQAAALTAKGVNVPDGAGFEDFPVLTEAIPSGGNTELEDGLVARTLTEYTNARVTSIGSYAFYAASQLKSVSFPEVDTLKGSNHFRACTGIENISFPKLTSIPSNSFYDCSALKLAEFGHLKTIAGNSFTNCTSLVALIIRGGTIASLNSVSAFTNSPFAVGGTGGVVYVPQATIEQYQTATNWSVLYEAGTCTFLPIEGSEYE